MRWRAAAHGSSWHSPPPARSAQFTVSCKERGPLEWWRRSGRSWPYAAGTKPGNEASSELIQPVERRHFISFRQRWIVEHRIAEVFDGRAQRQHSLSNVDDFRRPVSD